MAAFSGQMVERNNAKGPGSILPRKQNRDSQNKDQHSTKSDKTENGNEAPAKRQPKKLP